MRFSHGRSVGLMVSTLVLVASCSFIDENADGSRPDADGVAEDSPLNDFDLSGVEPDAVDFGGPVDEVRVMQPGAGAPLVNDLGWQVIDARHVLSLEDDLGRLDFWVARVVQDNAARGRGVEVCTVTHTGDGGGAGCGGLDTLAARTERALAGAMSIADSFSVQLQGGSDAVAFVVETDDRRIGIVPVAGFAFYRSRGCPRDAIVTTFYVDGTSRDEPLGRDFC